MLENTTLQKQTKPPDIQLDFFLLLYFLLNTLIQQLYIAVKHWDMTEAISQTLQTIRQQRNAREVAPAFGVSVLLGSLEDS